MRLLDAWLLIHENIAELVEFPDERSAPPYAILSHTWEHEEVLFSDIPLGPRHEIVPSRSALRYRQRHSCAAQAATHDSKPHIKAGWNKVLNTCMQACRDELEYVWIDTCCKSSFIAFLRTQVEFRFIVACTGHAAPFDNSTR